MDLKGKRLLILGGTYNADDINEYAREEGIILIATGNNKNHPLAKIANEFYYSDVTKVDEIVRVVKEHNIDGIFAGGNEDIIVKIFDVVDQTNIPFYAKRKQWEIAGDKKKLKKAFVKAGLPVVPEFYISNIPTQDELRRIEYPCVVKPVDGSGSKGVFLCESKEELVASLPKSLKFSRSQHVIVEKFMKGFIIVFYITAIEGNYYVASMCDKYAPYDATGKNRMPTIAQVYLYPSRHLDSCIEKYFPAIKCLLEDLEIIDGVVGIQGFCKDGDIVFTEMGYRLGGTSQQNYTKALYNYSNMFLLMNYALTGRMTDQVCRENPHFPKMCGTLQLISKGGTIEKVEGIEEVERMPEVISFEKHYVVGDTIPVVDNVTMVHFRLFIVAENLDRLKSTIDKIQKKIKVYDINGESMLVENFDVTRLDQDCDKAFDTRGGVS